MTGHRYLIDTNVILHVVNGSAGWEKIALKFDRVGHTHIAVSAVTVWEIYRMAERAKVSKRAIRASVELLSMFDVIPLSEQMAALGGSLSGSLSLRGINMSAQDSMIAATAMSSRMILVTDNTKDFVNTPGLALENWRAS